MTVVLVHGNPETDAVWDLIAARLTERGYHDQVRLSPPGFGAPVPDGFDVTPVGYGTWLVEQLRGFDQPVDLVGHDWGGLHVAWVAINQPRLLRSWASDALGALDPDYVGHDLAALWQSSGGESWVAEQLAMKASERAALLTSLGMDQRVAGPVAAGFDAVMGDCILRLYRTAAQPVMARLGDRLAAAGQRPGLAIIADADHTVGSDEQRAACAARAGAVIRTLPGLGHWWLTEQDGERGADALVDFWSSLSPEAPG